MSTEQRIKQPTALPKKRSPQMDGKENVHLANPLERINKAMRFRLRSDAPSTMPKYRPRVLSDSDVNKHNRETERPPLGDMQVNSSSQFQPVKKVTFRTYEEVHEYYTVVKEQKTETPTNEGTKSCKNPPNVGRKKLSKESSSYDKATNMYRTTESTTVNQNSDKLNAQVKPVTSTRTTEPTNIQTSPSHLQINYSSEQNFLGNSSLQPKQPVVSSSGEALQVEGRKALQIKPGKVLQVKRTQASSTIQSAAFQIKQGTKTGPGQEKPPKIEANKTNASSSSKPGDTKILKPQPGQIHCKSRSDITAQVTLKSVKTLTLFKDFGNSDIMQTKQPRSASTASTSKEKQVTNIQHDKNIPTGSAPAIATNIRDVTKQVTNTNLTNATSVPKLVYNAAATVCSGANRLLRQSNIKKSDVQASTSHSKKNNLHIPSIRFEAVGASDDSSVETPTYTSTLLFHTLQHPEKSNRTSTTSLGDSATSQTRSTCYTNNTSEQRSRSSARTGSFSLDRKNITVRRSLTPNEEIETDSDEIFIGAESHPVTFTSDDENGCAKSVVVQGAMSPIKPNVLTAETTLLLQGLPDVPAQKKTLNHHRSRSRGHSADAFTVSEDLDSIEYLEDIIVYLLEKDGRFVLKRHFLRIHNVNASHRACIVNWLLKVQNYYNLSTSTYLVAVRLFDTILAAIYVPTNMYQLIALTMLWIIDKFDENVLPLTAKKLVSICGGAYTAKQILKMEQKILKFIKFECNMQDPTIYVSYYMEKLNNKDKILLNCTYYILESYTLSQEFSTETHSLQAAAAFYLALKTLQGEDCSWHRLKEHHAYYDLRQIESTKQNMLSQLQKVKDLKYEYREPYRKYLGKERYEVSQVFLKNLSTS